MNKPGKSKMMKEQARNEKLEKSRRKVDDGQGLTTKGKGASANPKEKEKVKTRSQPENKSGETGTFLSSFPDSEPIFEDHSDVLRIKGKKRISKACQETVQMALSDFFDSAWLACAERFFIYSAPVAASFELRNTWLRIMDAEYQDYGLRGKVLSDKLNRVFKSDEPPLPLAFDSWSRGAIEPLPQHRRETIMDPFLRDLEVFRKSANIDQPVNPAATSSTMVENPSALTNEAKRDLSESVIGKPEIATDNAFPGAADVKPSVVNVTEDVAGGPVADVSEGETWNFELDPPQEIVIVSPVSSTPSSDYAYSLGSYLSSDDDTRGKEKHIHTLFSAWKFGMEESFTDIEFPAPEAKYGVSDGPKIVDKFSGIGQCQGKVEMTMFRLPLELSSEDLEITKASEESRHVEHSSLEHKDNVRTERKDVKTTFSVYTNVGLEVQPLFEDQDRTPRTRSVENNTHRLQHVGRRHPANANYSDHKVQSLDQVASDMDKRFKKRRLVNLHGRFRRQALRSLAAQMRKLEAERANRMSSSEVEGDSTDPSTANSGKTAKSRASSKKSNSRKSVSHKSISYSVSSVSMKSRQTRGESQVYFVSRKSKSKGSSSEPQLIIAKKKQSQKEQQKFSPRNMDKKPSNVTTKDKNLQSPHNNVTTGNKTAQSPHNVTTGNKTAQSSHNVTKRDNARSPRSVKTRGNLKSPHSFTGKGKTSSSRNISATSKMRSSRNFTSMANVRSSRKDFASPGNKFEDTKRAPNQFQYRFENKRKVPNESIELQGKGRSKPNQDTSCHSPSSATTCSINASSERLR